MYVRKQAPTRQMRSVEIFASTFNAGGVDRESACGVPSGGGGGGDRDETAAAPPKKSALQLVIPLWIPRGYDLYVRACVEVCVGVVGIREDQGLDRFVRLSATQPPTFVSTHTHTPPYNNR